MLNSAKFITEVRKRGEARMSTSNKEFLEIVETRKCA